MGIDKEGDVVTFTLCCLVIKGIFSSKTYKILVLFRTLAMLTKSLFANWISGSTFSTNALFSVSWHRGNGKPLTNLWFGWENKHDIAITCGTDVIFFRFFTQEQARRERGEPDACDGERRVCRAPRMSASPLPSLARKTRRNNACSAG